MIRLHHHPEDSIESLTERLRDFPATLPDFMAKQDEPVIVSPDTRIARGFCLFTIDGEASE